MLEVPPTHLDNEAHFLPRCGRKRVAHNPDPPGDVAFIANRELALIG